MKKIFLFISLMVVCFGSTITVHSQVEESDVEIEARFDALFFADKELSALELVFEAEKLDYDATNYLAEVCPIASNDFFILACFSRMTDTMSSAYFGDDELGKATGLTVVIAAKIFGVGDFEEIVPALREVKLDSDAAIQSGLTELSILLRFANLIDFPDLDQTRNLLIKSDAQYSDSDHYALAFSYAFGVGGERDLEKAVELLDRAADKGDNISKELLARIYLFSESPIRNRTRALEIFTDLTRDGHPVPVPSLIYAANNGVDVTEIASSAQNGDPVSQYMLANLLLFGPSNVGASTEALDWLKEAADAGLADAQYELASILISDIGEALRYLQMAAENGHLFAASDFGIAISWGLNGGNPATGLKWVQHSAALGDVDAAAFLSVYYLLNGENFDSETGLNWLAKASDLGDSFSSRVLGDLYLSGDLVEQSESKALTLFELAVEQGDDSATVSADLVCTFSNDPTIQERCDLRLD